MTHFNEKLTTQWKDWGNLLLGAWLAISPWVLSYAHTTAAWNAHVVGLIILLAALGALVAFQKWEEWVNTALGVWLIVSPFILGFSTMTMALSNQVIVGILVGSLSLWSAMTDDTRLISKGSTSVSAGTDGLFHGLSSHGGFCFSTATAGRSARLRQSKPMAAGGRSFAEGFRAGEHIGSNDRTKP